MVSQMALSCKVSVAPLVFAAEWFFPSMDPDMRLEVSILSKSLVALWTLKRFLSRMRPFVDLESARP